MEQKGQRILLVDDEESLLRLMKVFLERFGYIVTACTTAEQGMEAHDAGPDRFQVLIADLTLPGMQGDEMALHLLQRDEGIRVLLCSGYPFSKEALPENVRTRCAVLQKPFVPSALVDEVRRLLGSA